MQTLYSKVYSHPYEHPYSIPVAQLLSGLEGVTRSLQYTMDLMDYPHIYMVTP